MPLDPSSYRALLDELTPRQRALVQALVEDQALTKTDAARRAGYVTAYPGQQAYETLNRPNVKMALVAGRSERRDRARTVLDGIDSTLRKFNRAVEAIEDGQLRDIPTIIGGLRTLLEAKRVAMDIAERDGGDTEQRAQRGTMDYYERVERWTAIVQRVGFDTARRYARIAARLDAGIAPHVTRSSVLALTMTTTSVR